MAYEIKNVSYNILTIKIDKIENEKIEDFILNKKNKNKK